MKIAYLGIPGSFSYVAATSYFKSDQKELVGVQKFRDIFELIEQEKADAGIIPIENSLAGSIYENYDLFNQYNLNVTGELYLRIEHHLLGKRGTALDTIETVHSHPKALEQCTMFFEKYPKLKQLAATDTAAAAKEVAETDSATQGAIANILAAELYHLEVIQNNIEDHAHNFTRFLVIQKQKNISQDANKCSVIYTLAHTPGSLCNTLQFLADHKLNLTKIESRPIHGKPFEYTFYVDFEFTQETTTHLDQIMSDFRQSTRTLKILGFYKAGTY